MLTLLRSNQPIAWSIVPLTIALVAGVLSGWSGWELSAILIWSFGALCTAALGHLIYVSFEFADHPNPALSWLIVCLLTMGQLWSDPASIWLELRSWGSLILALWSAWWMMGVHRQGRVSGLTFRSGALAGLALTLEPINVGIVLGLALVLAKSRTFQTREWVMLILGTSWAPLLSLTLQWQGWTLPTQPWGAWKSPDGIGLYWLILCGGVTAIGWIDQAIRTKNEGIRRKASRANVALMTVLLAVGAIYFAGSTAHAWKLTAVAVAFAWVWLVPMKDRKSSQVYQVRLVIGWVAFLILLVGMALALRPL